MFRVVKYNSDYRTLRYLIMLEFQFSIDFRLAEDDLTIPKSLFNFCPLTDILNRVADDNYLVS